MRLVLFFLLLIVLFISLDPTRFRLLYEFIKKFGFKIGVSKWELFLQQEEFMPDEMRNAFRDEIRKDFTFLEEFTDNKEVRLNFMNRFVG